jgi:hypothetical protein
LPRFSAVSTSACYEAPRRSAYLTKKKRQWVAFVEAADEAEALEKARAMPEISEQD